MFVASSGRSRPQAGTVPMRSSLPLALCAAVFTAGAAFAAAPPSEMIDAAAMLQDVQTLSAADMEGRAVGTPGGARARAYVVERFRQAGVRPFGAGFVRDFEFKAKSGAMIRGANVAGFVPGTGKDAGWIVVSAHYDHLGIRGGEVYNGADDDASGTAALFALAARLKAHPLKHGVIFVAFDGEEAGDQGSHAFVQAPPVPLKDVVLDLNLDMVSRNTRHELYASGTAHRPYLKAWLDPLVTQDGLTLKFGHDAPEPHDEDWTWQSDHYAFHKAGVPYVYFGVEDHPDYHRPTDDFERIDPVFYVKAVETVAKALEAYDANFDAVVRAEKAAGRE
jgi:Zn-dependent M28 family amino/carboxypeptidase